MVFNISEFTSRISKRGGLAKNNLFVARFTLPPALSDLQEIIGTEDMSFLCKTVSIPNIDLDFIDIRPQGFGKPEHRPHEFRMGDLSAIFMVDAEFDSKKFFHRWMQHIVNYSDYGGTFQMDSANKLPYEFEYKESYAGTLEILVYSNNDANRVYSYRFGNVFPLSIGSVDFSWENSAEVLNLPVNFAFDKFTTDALELGQVTGDFSRANGILTYLSSYYGVGQAIQQVNRPRDIQDLINQFNNFTASIG
jgi:hypothetical protein